MAYLRSAFHTCYYCAVITDHLEELQRKCIMHVRKPLSKALKDEIKAAEADKAAKDEEQEVDKEKEKDNPTKPADGRDWKRNGAFESSIVLSPCWLNLVQKTNDGWNG